MPSEKREAWRRLSASARSKLEEMLDDEKTPKQTIAKIAEIATNRAWGTPTQSVELSGPDGGPIAHSELSDAALDAEVEARVKALMAEK